MASSRSLDAAVYPRGCGGTVTTDTDLNSGMGLSPRVRGNPVAVSVYREPGGSIPAGAGEPDSYVNPYRDDEVYPRGCGGTLAVESADGARYGLSPRVRGNPEAMMVHWYWLGSIPAGAGEPD